MWYRFFRFLFRIMFYSVFRLKVRGKHHVPEVGTVILCCNHMSLLDPPLLGSPLKRQVHFMAKAELFKVPVIGWLITQFGSFPVKRGGVSKESIRAALEVLNQQKIIGIFPEGTRNQENALAKKGAASLALKSNAIVIPVAIIGNYILLRSMLIVYGKPVDLSEFAGISSAHNLEKATEMIMSSIRTLISEHK